MLGPTSSPPPSAPATTSSRSPAPTSTSPTPPPCAPPSATRGRDAVINCAAWTDVDGAEADEAAATARQRRRRGQRRRRRGAPPARCIVHVSTDYVVRRHGDRAVRRVDARPAPLGAYGRSKLAGERAVAAAAPARTRSSAPRGCSAPHGTNFVDTMLRLARRARRGHGRRRPGRLPDLHGPSRRGAASRSPRRGSTGVAARRRRRRAARGTTSPRATFDARPALDVRACDRGRTADLGRPAPRPAFSVLAHASAPTRRACPPWQRRPARLPRRDSRWRAMRLLVCGGAGFIGSNFVRLRAARRTATRSPCSTSSPTPGREENLAGRARRAGFAFVHGGDRGPGAVAEAIGRRRRGRQLRRRDARRPLDRRARRVRHHPRARHLRAARGRPRARPALRAGLHRRGLRLDRGGLVHRGVAAAAVLARTRPRRPAPTCSSPPTATPTGSRR